MAGQISVLVGLPGSGKSSWCKPYRGDYSSGVVISSDEIRGLLGKDESDQTVNGKVFPFMETMAELLIRQGNAIFIDATNLTKKSRAPWVRLARKYGVTVRAYVVSTPVEECVKRNAARTRQVPEEVIRRMAKIREEITEDEGFTSVMEIWV